MKLDKIYYEFFALAVLKDYAPDVFRHITHGDSPDLKVARKIGIEVTQLGTEQEFQFLGIMNKIQDGKKISDFDKTVVQNCGYEIIDGMLVCTCPQNETNVYKTIESKLMKLKSGRYKDFQEYQLFMYFSDTLTSTSISDVIKVFKKENDSPKHYNKIFILWSTDLYIYDVDTDKLQIKDISLKVKKFRNFAINKQRDFEERRNRKPVRRYIADNHFFHANMNEKMDRRGFATTEEMNEYMIKQWNSVTKKNDEVIILGDFSFGNGKQTNEILRRLNGKKFLIEGNHDHKFLKDKDFDMSLLQWVKPYTELNDENRKVVACHYPVMFYNGQYRKMENGDPRTYMLFGHVHISQDNVLLNKMLETAKDFTFDSPYNGSGIHVPFNMINCFCMFSDYKPLTLDEWINL